MRIIVKAPCKPTEDSLKVRKAILNMFPELEVEEKDGEMEGNGSSIEKFKDLLEKQKIRAAARRILMGGKADDETRFRLNKQAAYMGVVSFGVNSPLGDITVVVEAENLQEVIDRIAPRFKEVDK